MGRETSACTCVGKAVCVCDAHTFEWICTWYIAV